ITGHRNHRRRLSVERRVAASQRPRSHAAERADAVPRLVWYRRTRGQDQRRPGQVKRKKAKGKKSKLNGKSEDVMSVRRAGSPAVLGLLLSLMLAHAGLANAAEIRVLCSNGIKAVVEELVPRFEQATRHKVVVKYGLAAALKQQI